MLYAILCYNSEDAIGSWSKDYHDQTMARLAVVQDKLDKLTRMDAKDFTKQYGAIQLAAHKDAVSLFERYGKGGENAELKGFAAKTLPHLQAHLKMAQDLNK